MCFLTKQRSNCHQSYLDYRKPYVSRDRVVVVSFSTSIVSDELRNPRERLEKARSETRTVTSIVGIFPFLWGGGFFLSRENCNNDDD